VHCGEKFLLIGYSVTGMEQNSLPIKTKICVWITMVITGFFILVDCLIFLFPHLLRWGIVHFVASVVDYVSGIFLPFIFFPFPFLPSACRVFIFIICLFVLKKKKWAWCILLVSLVLSSLVGLLVAGFLILAEILGPPWGSSALWLCLIPIFSSIISILLFLDRRNFWKIAT